MKKILASMICLLFSANIVFAEGGEEMLEWPEPDVVVTYAEAATVVPKISMEQAGKISEKLTDGVTEVPGWMKEVIEKNRPAIDLFEQATKQKPTGHLFGVPPEEEHYDPFTAPMPRLFFVVDYSRLLLLEFDDLWVNGKYDEAVSKLETALRAYHHLRTQKHSALLSFINSNIIFENFLISRLKFVAGREEADQANRKKIKKELGFIKNKTLSLGDILKNEKEEFGLKKYLLFLHKEMARRAKNKKDEEDAVLFLKEGAAFCEREVDPFFEELISLIDKNRRDEIVDLVQRVGFDNSVEAIEEKMLSLEEKLWQEGNEKDKEDFYNFLKKTDSNIIFKILFLSSIKSYGKKDIIDFYFISTTKINGLKALFDVREYYDKKQKWPVSWDDIDEEAPKVPFNNFESMKIKHIENGIRIYSVGPDRIDDGGMINIPIWNNWKKDEKGQKITPSGDIVFELTR